MSGNPQSKKSKTRPIAYCEIPECKWGSNLFRKFQLINAKVDLCANTFAKTDKSSRIGQLYMTLKGIGAMRNCKSQNRFRTTKHLISRKSLFERASSCKNSIKVQNNLNGQNCKLLLYILRKSTFL